MYIRASLIRHCVLHLSAVVLCWPPIATHAQERGTATQDQTFAEYMAEPKGLLAEPGVIERAVIFSDRHFGNGEITSGFYSDSFNMIPGAGWISAGPGYRQWYSKDRVFVDASAAISWRGYKTAQARFELPRLVRSRLLVGSQVRWQDFKRVSFFGEGPDAPESNLSRYRLKSKNMVGYASLRPVKSISIDTEVGWLDVFALSDQPTFIHSEAAITADTRDFPGHPIRGGLVRAATAHYSDRDSSLFSFRRYEAEAARFMPFVDSRLVLALHGWIVTSDTREGQFVPFYLQPSLGGHNSLRGYSDFRFHDRNLMLINAEARIAMMTHVDAAVFVDAGNVAARFSDLNLDKRSYGAGLRLHSRRQSYARFDVARSVEGWRFVVRLTEPLNLARNAKRTAAVPFVP